MTGCPRHRRAHIGCPSALLLVAGLSPAPPAQGPSLKALHRNIEVLMTLPSRSEVRVAVSRLSDGGKAVVPELLTLLHDPRLIVRTQVYRVLGDLGEHARAAVPDLVRQSARSSDPWERVRAAQLALKIDPSSVPAMHVLGRSSNMNYRADAAWGLGESPGRKNVELLAALIDDEMRDVRQIAFRSLVQHGADAEPVLPKVIDALVGRHAQQLDPEEIPGAINSNGTALDGAGNVLSAIGDHAVKALLQRHAKADANTQLHVLNTLGGMGARQAQREAIRVSLLAADATVRRVAYECLMHLEVTDSAELPTLLGASVRFSDPGMGDRIVRYLRSQSATSAVLAMRTAMAKADAAGRRSLIELLPDLQRTKRTRHVHTELLLNALRDLDAAIRHAAARTIARYPDPDRALRAPLLRMLHGPCLADREAAQVALRAWSKH
jgi:HEAT repeat protein